MKLVPSGVITLTTDFGHKGPFVATMKGVMLTRFPAARIVDLTHEIMVHWPAEAGFWLERSFRYFPKGTAHVAVVDPGVGTERDIVAFELEGHMFMAPDNGLLAPLASIKGRGPIHKIDIGKLAALGLRPPSATFHGRDVFAPLIAELAAGRITIADLGPTKSELIPSWIEEPEVGADRITGLVITIDNFGNLITNISRAQVERFKKPVVEVSGHRLPFLRTYGDVKPGDYLTLINSFEVLEIARAEQSAADALGAGRGAPVVVAEG
jgi:S-adenosyl-L-methionine hydrolase (adenosine-forming)